MSITVLFVLMAVNVFLSAVGGFFVGYFIGAKVKGDK
jgi:hypothetical protein